MKEEKQETGMMAALLGPFPAGGAKAFQVVT
jgi:hypothetical protein